MNSTTQNEREQFEAWWSGSMDRPASFLRGPSGIYASDSVMIAWTAWQASASQVAAPPALPVSQEPVAFATVGKGSVASFISLTNAGRALPPGKYFLRATPQPAEQAELSDAVKIVQDLIDSHRKDTGSACDEFCDIVAGMEAARDALSASKGRQ